MNKLRYWLVPFQTYKVWKWRVRYIALRNWNKDIYSEVPTLREKYLKK
tara:strand:+ start:221 stop:364 length:144 start_codon:yes stop_codon:yes gene_type:complete